MHRVREQHRLVVAQGIQQLFIALNESLLLAFIELARNDIRLVIFQAQPMQQRDQSRTAFVNEAEFPLDPGTDLARRARQRRADKHLQCIFLRGAQKTRATADVKTAYALDAALLKQLVPAADRVVVQQQGIRDFLATPPAVQQNQGVRTSRHPRRRRPIAGQRDQLIAILYTEKAATNHAPSESTKPQSATNFSRAFNESGYICQIARSAPGRPPRPSANTGESKTSCTTPAMSPSARRCLAHPPQPGHLRQNPQLRVQYSAVQSIRT